MRMFPKVGRWTTILSDAVGTFIAALSPTTLSGVQDVYFLIIDENSKEEALGPQEVYTERVGLG
jgi:hypothetical protein